MKEQH